MKRPIKIIHTIHKVSVAVAQSKHCVSITNASLVNTVRCVNPKQRIHAVRVYTAELLFVKLRPNPMKDSDRK